jgi:hypothetical protein
MLTRLKNWIQGSRRKSGEQWQADHGHLSEQERRYVEHHEQLGTIGSSELDDAYTGPQSLDEGRRGRPGN